MNSDQNKPKQDIPKQSRSKFIWFILLTVAILAAAVPVAYFVNWRTDHQPIYIAVATTLSNSASAEDGKALLAGVQLYVQQTNDKGGIHGHTIIIKNPNLYDDQGDKSKAQQIAREIANDPDIVGVIGHLFSSTSMAAGEIYQQQHVPAIAPTASATSLQDNGWYFGIVPSNAVMGAFLANYAHRVLPQYKNTTIIYDQTDAYSRSLEEGFKYPFKGLGNHIHNVYDLNAQNADRIIDTIVSDVLKNSSDTTGLIFIALQKDEAQKLIVALRRKGIQNPMLAGDALGGASFENRFNNEPEEQSQPGFFTNYLYATSPVIFDSANEDAQSFLKKYQSQNHQDPTWIAATGYDAAHVLLDAIDKTRVGGPAENLAEQRRTIRDYIAGQYNSPDKAIKGISGDIYFNKQLGAVKPVAIGVFSEGNFISAPTQYSPISNINLVSNLEQDQKDGRIIIMNGNYARRTSIVYTGMEFNEISGLDESTSTYHMDFYIWFRYQGDVDATNIQFLNAAGDVSLGDPLQTKDLPNDIHYQLFRVRGDFKSAFDFRTYPFDQQTLNVRFRHANLTRDNLVYVVDVVSLKSKPSMDPGVFHSGGDWHISQPGTAADFVPGSTTTNSTLGDPQFFGQRPDIEYATFKAEIPIARNVLSFILRNLLPVIFTLLLTYMSYFLPASEFGTRSGLLSGSILTIAFFHLGVSSGLKVGYTVALDYAFYAFYAIILISLLVTMLEWYMHIQGENSQKAIGTNNGPEHATMSTPNKSASQGNHRKESRQSLIPEPNEPLGQSAELRMRTAGRIFFPAALISVFFAYWFIFYGQNLTRPFQNSQSPSTTAQPISTSVSSPGKVTLTIGSWRVDDQTQMNTILAVFNKEHPNIEVKFTPAIGSQYENILKLQLQNGNGPDLFYLSSAGGRIANPSTFYGDTEPLTTKELPGLDNYHADALNTWSENDQLYALPLYAVSHGIYYNEDIFKQLQLSVPQTWGDLIGDAQVIKAAGKIPFANTLYTDDPQRVGDLIFTNMAPTFIGGAEGRKQYEQGQRCFNDSHVVRLFTAIQYMSQYMAPPPSQPPSYQYSQRLFLQGKAAMYFGGSFEIPTFEQANPLFHWSVFAIPPPQDLAPYVNYHIDTAIAINAKTPHKVEAIEFMTWLTTPEFAGLLGQNLPGLFPLNTQAPPLTDPSGKDFLALNQWRGLDVRWVLPNTGLPDWRTLIQEAALGVISKQMSDDNQLTPQQVTENGLELFTPRQAADHLQNGLGQWYLPAQQCLP